MSKKPEFDYSNHSDVDLIAVHKTAVNEVTNLGMKLAAAVEGSEEERLTDLVYEKSRRKLDAVVAERQRRAEEAER